MRLADNVHLRATRPLPFDDGAFDDVVASLVLHYMPDWTAPLAELRRVLQQGGRLIISVNHPILYKLSHPDADYFATTQFSEQWTYDGRSWPMTFRHRPLHAMTEAFTQAGFRLSTISEPPPSPGTPRNLFPPDLDNRSAFLCFIFFVLDAS